MPFIIYLAIWTVFFVSMNTVLGVNQPKLDGVNQFYSNYINMFRITFGDIMEPIFECPEGRDCTYTYVRIWLVFVAMVYLMTIILNNFLIAKVSSVYESF